MSEPTKQSSPEQSGPRIYETDAPAKTKTAGGVYDAPASKTSLPIGMIIAIVVIALILVYLLFQFVF